jgi:hypothetical protein
MAADLAEERADSVEAEIEQAAEMLEQKIITSLQGQQYNFPSHFQHISPDMVGENNCKKTAMSVINLIQAAVVMKKLPKLKKARSKNIS